MAQTVKNPPAIQETQVLFLDWEDTLEKKMATHSSILAWKIPWTEELGGLQSMRAQRVEHDLVTEQRQQQREINFNYNNINRSKVERFEN